ncbi:MAG: DUF5916 domain-containing protein [Bacteroidota bacterium]
MRTVITSLTAIYLLLSFSYLYAQPEREMQVALQIKSIDEKVLIDGNLDEGFWESLPRTSPFINKWPVDSGYADSQTEVRMAYDQEFVYIAAVCQDGPEYVIQSLKRDTDFFDSDGFSVVIDPVGRKTNGFFFGVNALGAQSEGLVGATMDEGDFNFDWDNRWYSAVQNYEDHWVVEIAIPFKTLRYEAGNKRWGINFIRNDIKRNRYSTWSYVPLNFMGIDMGYLGDLHWDQDPPVAKGNVSIIPYAIGGMSKDYEEGTDLATTYNAGLDAKVALSPSLNLDLTVNPDFSQVDVDEQVTNLERFNLFFPEKRNFFLENSDLFSSFGIPPTRPFFSRQIGLELLPDGQPVPIPILFGARLTGNLTDKLRIGILDVQTGARDDISGQNVAVAAGI